MSKGLINLIIPLLTVSLTSCGPLVTQLNPQGFEKIPLRVGISLSEKEEDWRGTNFRTESSMAGNMYYIVAALSCWQASSGAERSYPLRPRHVRRWVGESLKANLPLFFESAEIINSDSTRQSYDLIISPTAVEWILGTQSSTVITPSAHLNFSFFANGSQNPILVTDKTGQSTKSVTKPSGAKCGDYSYDVATSQFDQAVSSSIAQSIGQLFVDDQVVGTLRSFARTRKSASLSTVSPNGK